MKRLFPAGKVRGCPITVSSPYSRGSVAGDLPKKFGRDARLRVVGVYKDGASEELKTLLSSKKAFAARAEAQELFDSLK